MLLAAVTEADYQKTIEADKTPLLAEWMIGYLKSACDFTNRVRPYDGYDFNPFIASNP